MEIKGIQVKIHPTFIVLLLISIFAGLALRAFIVFGLVILHEFFHMAVARSYGVKITRIEIYPYGGTAVLEDTFEGKRKDETIIALAGPAFNFTLFLVIAILRWEGILTGAWALELQKINFWLAMFNLLPVLPLDGGRIVRALFAGTFGFVKTTKFLASAGKWVGGIFVFIGFLLQGFGFYFYEPVIFIVLGIFFWLGSRKELANAQVVFLKQLCRKKEALLRNGLMASTSFAVTGDTILSKIINQFNSDRYSIVHVIGKRDGIQKTLSETEIVQAMMDRGLNCKVGDLEIF